MKAEYSDITVLGKRLHRLTLHPDSDTPTVAACIFTHGQGDYGERYLDVLHPFTTNGIRCIITDLQGHGRSSGKRGHVGNRQFIDAVIQSNLEATENLPTGIAGHSMGGLLTLRYLALALEDKLPLPEFCWVNCPLLHPGNGRPDWFIRVANILSNISPSTTIHTGVTPEMCRLEDSSARLPKDPLSLGHQRVSIGWGTELIRIADYTLETLKAHSYPNPFLLTQGGKDSVCPPAYAHAFYEQLHWQNKRYKEFPEMLHETFAEAEREELFSLVDEWLRSSVTAKWLSTK